MSRFLGRKDSPGELIKPAAPFSELHLPISAFNGVKTVRCSSNITPLILLSAFSPCLGFKSPFPSHTSHVSPKYQAERLAVPIRRLDRHRCQDHDGCIASDEL